MKEKNLRTHFKELIEQNTLKNRQYGAHSKLGRTLNTLHKLHFAEHIHTSNKRHFTNLTSQKTHTQHLRQKTLHKPYYTEHTKHLKQNTLHKPHSTRHTTQTSLQTHTTPQTKHYTNLTTQNTRRTQIKQSKAAFFMQYFLSRQNSDSQEGHTNRSHWISCDIRREGQGIYFPLFLS